MERHGSPQELGAKGGKTMNATTLYHGSFVVVQHPLVNVGRRELDFGPGFYVTHLRDQAERWARRVCIIRASETPIISTYTFDEETLPDGINRLILEHYNQEWLDFIVASRRGQEPWAEYDIIEGGVANDQVIDTVEDYFSGRITAEQALGQLQFAKPTHQMCIRNQAIIENCLRFVKSEQLEKKGGHQ
jgi:hypothetical protein